MAEVTGLVPVEYPTTRHLGASPQARAADLNAAFTDPAIRAIIATVGGDDQITVIPHLDADAVRREPKPFLGYSDNTNLHQWLWNQGIASFYGGSTQVHLGPGPGVDDEHARSLRAALLTGETIELTRPETSEDHGLDWTDPLALTTTGEREPTEEWTWAGPARIVSGATWGGCLEVLEWVLTAGRFPADPRVLDGGVLLVETSELLLPAENVGWILRSLGERGLLSAVEAVLVARPPVSNFDRHPDASERSRLRMEQRDTVIALSVGTTLTPSCAWASRSGTRGPSGSFRTAAPSRLTARLVESSLTTPDPRASKIRAPAGELAGPQRWRCSAARRPTTSWEGPNGSAQPASRAITLTQNEAASSKLGDLVSVSMAALRAAR